MTNPRIITAEEFDRITPNECAAAFDERIVRDLAELPLQFRTRVEERARSIAEELRPPSAS